MNRYIEQWVLESQPHPTHHAAPFIATFSALFFLFNKLEACADAGLMSASLGVLHKCGAGWHKSWMLQHPLGNEIPANPISIMDWKQMPKPAHKKIVRGPMNDDGAAFTKELSAMPPHASGILLFDNYVVCVHKLGEKRFILMNTYPTLEDCSVLASSPTSDSRSFMLMNYDESFVYTNSMNLFNPRKFCMIMLDLEYATNCVPDLKRSFKIKKKSAPVAGKGIGAPLDEALYEEDTDDEAQWYNNNDSFEPKHWMSDQCLTWNKVSHTPTLNFFFFSHPPPPPPPL